MEIIAKGVCLLMRVFGCAPIVVCAHRSHNQFLRGAATKLLLGFILLPVSTRPVKGQTEYYSLSRLPDDPVAKTSPLDKKPKFPGSEPSQPATTTDANGRTHKYTTTTKLWLASSLAVYTAAALDMNATEGTLQALRILHKKYPEPPWSVYYFEQDPLMKPLLKLPAPAYYACGAAIATGINWVGLRMSRSKRFRKVWWLPQAISVTGNTRGYLSNQ